VTASTVTEMNGSDTVGSGAPRLGNNKTIAPLDRVRVDSTDRPLTTNQGVLVGDNQHPLKAGLRGPTLPEDSFLRARITNLDHERIPADRARSRIRDPWLPTASLAVAATVMWQRARAALFEELN
jgi:hypothetical protein